jgi:hypothetical protein
MAAAWFLVISPALAKQAEETRRVYSANNLHQIGVMLMLYESDPSHGGYPAELSALDISDPRLLINPRFPQLKPGYIYVPGVSSQDATRIIAYDNVPDDQAAAGRNVLLADGSVLWLSGEEFKKYLKEQGVLTQNVKQDDNAADVRMPKSMWDSLDLGSSKVGDFAEYELPVIKGKERREVKAVGDHTMTIEFTTFNGDETKKSSTKIAYDTADKNEELGVEFKSSHETVEIPKGKYEATRYDVFQNGLLQCHNWFSKEIPVIGMIKSSTAEGEVAAILTNFGRAK